MKESLHCFFSLCNEFKNEFWITVIVLTLPLFFSTEACVTLQGGVN